MAAVSALAGWLPPGLGQSAVSRSYVSLNRWPPESRVRQRFRGGANLELDMGDRTQAEAYLERGYELELVRYAAENVPQAGVVLDVGANVGLVTFQLLARRPDLRIYAFEPNQRNVAAWRRNRELNPHGVAELSEVAVGSETGSGTLVVPSDSGSGFIDSGSGGVAVITLDSFLRDRGIEVVELLKLDVEGFEHRVLRGAHESIDARRIRRIVCEFNDAHLVREGTTKANVVRSLTERGFVQRNLPSVGARAWRGVRADDLAFELTH